jgi:iron complex transport system substrate-binding protein
VTQGPRRIVCLTERPTEVLYALRRAAAHRRHQRLHGASRRRAARKAEGQRVHVGEDRRDPEAEPDFVVGFSDIQADIAAELIRHGVEVWISNHRSVDGILDYVARLGALVGAARPSRAVRARLRDGLDAIAATRRSCRAGRRSISKNGMIR